MEFREFSNPLESDYDITSSLRGNVEETINNQNEAVNTSDNIPDDIPEDIYDEELDDSEYSDIPDDIPEDVDDNLVNQNPFLGTFNEISGSRKR